MKEAFNLFPQDFIYFSLVTLFSLLIGLEQRKHHNEKEISLLFGTDRTFALIGILGFILYVMSPDSLIPFLMGGGVLTVWLAVYYYQHIEKMGKYGLTSLVTAMITYCLSPLIYTQPKWLFILIVVMVLVMVEIKESLLKFSNQIDNSEFITLAKFLVFAGVILPLLPDTPISAQLNISPYRFWLAIVAVSSISYVSYILKKFIFPNSGMLLTGILGGLYSSTATTVILSKKSKELNNTNEICAAIVLATTMMYLRIFLLALFFNPSIALKLIPSFFLSILASLVLAFFILKSKHFQGISSSAAETNVSSNNPLEFKTAMVFAVLFIVFGLATSYINTFYGTTGINVLSFVVGVTDIDPFILNLFQSKWNIEDSVLVSAVLNAITSNNLLKLVYGFVFGNKRNVFPLSIAFGTLIVLGLLSSFVLHLY